MEYAAFVFGILGLADSVAPGQSLAPNRPDKVRVLYAY
jgi:hypothetical protein